jgi:hypothetical protein
MYIHTIILYYTHTDRQTDTYVYVYREHRGVGGCR